MQLKIVTALLMLIVHSENLRAQTINAAPLRLDSLTLVRTSCLGPCPAYRLDISATGLVRFVSQQPSTTGRTSTQASSPDMVPRIERVLVAHNFRSLPDIGMGQLPYCGVVATDHPTITVTTFERGTHVSKSYYTGCHGAAYGDTLPRPHINALRIIADSIDAIAAKPEWTRPARLWNAPPPD